MTWTLKRLAEAGYGECIQHGGNMFSNKLVVGFCGPFGSGKDACCDILVRERGFIKIGFADALRECLWTLDPVIGCTVDTHRGLYGLTRIKDVVSDWQSREQWDKAKNNEEVRRLLQRLGTDVVRDLIGKNVWANILTMKIDSLERAAICDVRFGNEERVIRNFDGILLRVMKPSRRVDDKPEEIVRHTSETTVLPFDDTIYNTGDLEYLQRILLEKFDSWLTTKRRSEYV